METDDLTGGSGSRFGRINLILTGLAALAGILITIVSIWLQAKNYRQPLLQRYVIRILFLVPIFSAASWASLISTEAAQWIDPFRDVYEAFTIYAFFQLLINFIGGERALIILMVGRAPVSHIWPLNHFFNKVDISDPHTFLAIKRGILQYTWIKPILAMATIIMKATDTYKEGYASVDSGYLWSGIIYNISISVSLYALAMFWICMSDDLAAFRPMPKFLCIKGIIFASYWQGFFLSILVAMGAIPDDVPGYTRDNLAAAIQDTLICFEMPIFAVLHWYAFSWKDYADASISSARMPIKYALRDACGPIDLIQDAKETFAGSRYEYRNFDAGDNVLAHEESRQRMAKMREGMRYERGGKGKYWIPKPGQSDSKTPLLDTRSGSETRGPSSSRSRERSTQHYGTSDSPLGEEPQIDPEEEKYYAKARALEFGDWNYPVITAHHATREDRLYHEPRIVTSSTNRHILQPTAANKSRRKRSIEEIQKSVDKGKRRESSSSGKSSGAGLQERIPVLSSLAKHTSSSSQESENSQRSQLVDLVVEDDRAEEVERVRARKEGSPEWNKHDPKHFVKTYPSDDQAEVVREGFEPVPEYNQHPDQQHTLPTSFAIDPDEEEQDREDGQPSASDLWKSRDYTDTADAESDELEQTSSQQQQHRSVSYADMTPEENVWDSPKR